MLMRLMPVGLVHKEVGCEIAGSVSAAQKAVAQPREDKYSAERWITFLGLIYGNCQMFSFHILQNYEGPMCLGRNTHVKIQAKSRVSAHLN